MVRVVRTSASGCGTGSGREMVKDPCVDMWEMSMCVRFGIKTSLDMKQLLYGVSSSKEMAVSRGVALRLWLGLGLLLVWRASSHQDRGRWQEMARALVVV